MTKENIGPVSITAWKRLGGAEGGTVAALAIGDRHTAFIGTKVGVLRSTQLDSTSAQSWERLAQAPIGALSLAASPDFAQDHTVLAGTDTGIFVSRNAGDTWQAAQIPQSHSMVLVIAFSPNYVADGLIVAGTLEDGIWVSYNRGESWVARSFGLLDATVFSLALSPDFAHDETIYAGTESAVYYTYNSARAWKHLPSPSSEAPILSLALSPDFSSDRTLFAGTDKLGLFRSVDRGVHWEGLNLPSASASALVASREYGLLAATETGIYQSKDHGDTWGRLADMADTISLAQKNELLVAGQVDQGAWMASGPNDWHPIALPPARSILGLALSPVFDRDRTAFMYGLQEGIWRTPDGGTTWAHVNEALPSLDIQALAVSPGYANRGILIAASPEGLFRSTDGGDTWQVLAEEPAVVVAFSPNGKWLAAAFAEAGLRVSEDEGKNWAQVPGPWDTGAKVVALAISDEGYFHAALLEGVDDTLAIWQGQPEHYAAVLRQPTQQNPVVCLWVPAGENARWYASLGNRVWAFGDGPANEPGILPEQEDVLALRGTQDASGLVLFACTKRHLFTSRDGASWQPVYDFGEETTIAFALSPTYSSDKTAYVLQLGGSFGRVSG